MPLYLLKIKADLEGINKLIPLADNLWKLDIQNDAGDTKSGITVSKADVIDLEGSKGQANYVMRWAKGAPQAYIKIVDVKKVDGSYKSDDSGKFVTVLGLECRGIEPIAWVVGEDFTAESSGGTTFQEGVDLSEDWADYDEEHDESVSVMNTEVKIEK